MAIHYQFFPEQDNSIQVNIPKSTPLYFSQTRFACILILFIQITKNVSLPKKLFILVLKLFIAFLLKPLI